VAECCHERLERATVGDRDERVCGRAPHSRAPVLEQCNQLRYVAAPLESTHSGREELEHATILPQAQSRPGVRLPAGARRSTISAMARKAVKIGVLRKVPLFAGCSRQDLANVASIGYEDEFPAG